MPAEARPAKPLAELGDVVSATASVPTVSEACGLLRRGEVSPRDLVEMFLKRIEALEPHLHAFTTLDADRARAEAAAAQSFFGRGKTPSPTCGIPFGLKDIIDAAGLPTTSNSRVGIGYVPTADAGVTRTLREAGAVLTGKLATWEFAHGQPDSDAPWPEARNPWNLGRTTAGSSSGSAVAVAAGLLPFALGTDTGGSIRGPACYNGIAGLKPTYGLVSRAGIVPNSFSFDYCGPMAWTVEDCALVLQAIAGHDAADPASSRRPVDDYSSGLGEGLKGLRIGVLRHVWEEDIAIGAEAAAAMETALAVLRDCGASLEVARIRPIQQYYDVKTIIAETEIFSVHQRGLRDRLGEYGADFLARTLAGCLFSAADYVQAQRFRRQLMDEMQPLYDRFDVLVTCGLGPAPPINRPETVDYRSKWTRPNPWTAFNVTGGPALSVCDGFSADGLPMSIQFVGRPFDEPTVLRAGHAYETATGWRSRRPRFVAAPASSAASAPGLASQSADPKIADIVRNLTSRAGLDLPEPLFETLCSVAPYVFEMAGRIPRSAEWQGEPANGFHW